MGDRSAIEWTDATWNPVRVRHRDTGRIGWHCEHVSDGCRNCYAERTNLAGRNAFTGTRLPYKPGHLHDITIYLDESVLLAPCRWRRPRMIFAGSMTDLFADFVTDAMLDRIFAVMTGAWWHTFQLPTKRPARMRAYLADPDLPVRIARAWCYAGRNIDKGWSTRAWRANGVDSTPRIWPLPNVWLGTSCENQATADARVPELLATPSAVRFVSAEPLLSRVSFRWLSGVDHLRRLSRGGAVNEYDGLRRLDWVIVGGESGPQARPMHPDWARTIRDECAAAGVEFFFKQWGGWSTSHKDWPKAVPLALADDGTLYELADIAYPDGKRYGEAVRLNHDKAHLTSVYRVGKKTAGRLLDGVEHNGFPKRAEVADAAA